MALYVRFLVQISTYVKKMKKERACSTSNFYQTLRSETGARSVFSPRPASLLPVYLMDLFIVAVKMYQSYTERNCWFFLFVCFVCTIVCIISRLLTSQKQLTLFRLNPPSAKYSLLLFLKPAVGGFFGELHTKERPAIDIKLFAAF